MRVEFQGFNPFIRQMRSDKGWRLEIDLDESQYDAIKDLPKYQDVILRVIIENNE